MKNINYIISCFILCFLLCGKQSFTQDLCFKLDSLVINYIPLNSSTILALSEYDVINAASYSFKTRVSDFKSLSEFTKIDIDSNCNKNLTPLDTRLVIRAYSKASVVLTISMNKRFSFSSEEKKRFESEELKNWILNLDLKNLIIRKSELKITNE